MTSRTKKSRTLLGLVTAAVLGIAGCGRPDYSGLLALISEAEVIALCEPPGNTVVFVAYRVDAGDWTVARRKGSVFIVPWPLAAKAGLTVVSSSAAGTDVHVYYGIRDELSTLSNCQSSTQNATGTVSGLNAGETAVVSVGFGGVAVQGLGTRSVSVPMRTDQTDLLAVVHDENLTVRKMIMRRALDGSMPYPTFDVLDFSSPELFVPTTPALTIAGAAGEPVTFAEWYLGTRLSCGDIYYGRSSTTTPTTYYGVPEV